MEMGNSNRFSTMEEIILEKYRRQREQVEESDDLSTSELNAYWAGVLNLPLARPHSDSERRYYRRGRNSERSDQVAAPCPS